MKNLFLIAVIVLGFSAASFGQSSATADASATLITPISIAKTGDMNFGTVSSSNTAGTVALAFTGTATYDGGAKLVAGGAATTAAKFQVTGEGTSSFSVSYPTSIVLTGATPANTLTVNNIVADSGATASLVSGGLEILVKGTLVVPALSVADVYTNTTELTVTVNYN